MFADGVMRTFFLFASGILGLILGSFATALAYRLPRGQSVATGRSKCPNCEAEIGALQNIPLFSWIFLRGRCKNCGDQISARYPLTELATGVSFAGAAARFGFSAEALIYAGFFWALVVLTAIDLEFKLLPNKVVFPLVAWTYGTFGLTAVVRGDPVSLSRALGLAAVALIAVIAVMVWPSPEPVGDELDEDDPPSQPVRELLFGFAALAVWIALLVLGGLDGPFRGFAGAVIGGALFSLVLLGIALVGSALSGRTAMGGGDIKLAVALGAALGYLEAPGIVLVGIFLSFLAGGLLSVAILLVTKDRKKQIPFGPFLAVGTALGVFAGQRLLGAYLGTL